MLPAFLLLVFAFPWISDTGATEFFGNFCLWLLSVPCGALGSGRLMPAFDICFSPMRYLLGLGRFLLFLFWF